MRVLVIGGTQFVGRLAARQLKDRGHAVAVLHRGEHEPSDLGDVVHIHGHRDDLTSLLSEIDEFAPELVWDNTAMSGRQAEHVVNTLGRRQYIVTSSVDVYGAYGAFLAGIAREPVPCDEESPLRKERYPFRGKVAGMDDYDKLDVEEVYLAASATVTRWPTVYGPNDPQCREEYVLSRVRAGRTRIPVGSGSWLKTKALSNDIAVGMRLAIENEDVRGKTFNLGEHATYPMGQWTQMILDAAGSDAELVRVPDDRLPEDLWLLGAVPQHVLVDSRKARRVLGFTNTEARESLQQSVAWHLVHPPAESNTAFDGDELAFRSAE